MLISYLWRERDRDVFASRRWWRSWAKRIYTAPALIRTSLQQWWLRFHTAQIECPVFLSPSQFNGKVGNLTVGRNSFLGRITVHLHARVEVGRNVVINDGVVLMTASHDLGDPGWRSVAKPIVVEDYAWIATNALILPGVTIGYGAVVGAGAVVRQDVPKYALVTGNPVTLTEDARCKDLQYRPTSFLPLFRAWVGGENSGNGASHN